MDTIARLETLAAMPHTHFVVTRYADGRERRHGARSEVAAKNYSMGERRKIGRELIDRETGATVRVVSVKVEPA
jgi:hypothetical protein